MARPREVSAGNPSKDTIRKQTLFLKAYAASGVIAKACGMSEVTRETVMNWRKNDILFLEGMNEAREIYNDSLEEILNDLISEMHRNLDYKANPTLLIFKMNGAMPQKYKGVSQVSSDAKDVLSEFRKAMRESRNGPDPTEKSREPVEEKSPVEQANDIIQGKFGSLNGSDGT